MNHTRFNRSLTVEIPNIYGLSNNTVATGRFRIMGLPEQIASANGPAPGRHIGTTLTGP